MQENRLNSLPCCQLSLWPPEGDLGYLLLSCWTLSVLELVLKAEGSQQSLSPCQSLEHTKGICAVAPPHTHTALAVTLCPLRSPSCSARGGRALQGPELRLWAAVGGCSSGTDGSAAPTSATDRASFPLGPNVSPVLHKCSKDCQVWMPVTWPVQVLERRVRLGIPPCESPVDLWLYVLFWGRKGDVWLCLRVKSYKSQSGSTHIQVSEAEVNEISLILVYIWSLRAFWTSC